MASYTWDPITSTYVLSADQSFSVTTDQLDYSPGSTASITAAGSSAGDAIEITAQVIEANGTLGAITFDTTLTIGSDGTAATTMWIDPALYTNQNILLTATDLTAGVMATERFADAPPTDFLYVDNHIDLSVAMGTTLGTTALVAGAIWANDGTTLDPNGSTGSGVFSTFSEVQQDNSSQLGTEQGFDTTAVGVLNGGSDDTHNFTIHLSNLVAVDASGNPITSATPVNTPSYYAFKLDVHQNTNNSYLSLDELQIWQSHTDNLGNGSFTANDGTAGTAPSFSFNSGSGTLVYDLNSTQHETSNQPNSVLLNSQFTAGSGGGSQTGSDLVVLIPTADFDPAKGDSVYLYSAFGYQGGSWAANSTFEEWGAQTGTTAPNVTPLINVEKLVSVNGGTTWYLNPDDGINGESAGDITAVTAAITAVLPSGQTLISDGSVPSATPGGTVDYEVVVTNTGNVTDTNVSVTDSPLLPGPFTFSSTILAPGASLVSSVVTSMAGAAGSGFADTATVTANYGNTLLTDSDTASFTVAAAQPTAVLSGFKYEDANGNGMLDPGTDGAPKVGFEIFLYQDNGTVAGQLDANDTLVDHVTTDAAGAYSFGPLNPGSYIIVEGNQAGWVQSPDVNTMVVNGSSDVGFDSTKSENGYLEQVRTSNVGDLNFANFHEITIEGTKYNDIKGDDGTVAVGTADDIGLAGVTIDLIDANTSAVVAMTTTGTGGHYEFDNVLPLGAGDTYLVKEVVPANSTQTYGSAGYVITPTSGADLKGNDFANFADFKIEGTKYNDVKGDDGTVAVGTADDIGLAGVTIDLIDANTSAVVAMTTTGTGGHYEFDNVLPLGAGDSYLVKEVVPANSTQTYGSAGYVITPTSGADLKGNDFANFADFKIEGTKYNDVKGDDGTVAVGTADDIGLAGVTIDLIDANTSAVVAMTTTGTGGHYEFDNVLPLGAGDSYLVKEVVPANSTQTYGSAGYVITPASGADLKGNDFANFADFKIEGTKYNDVKGDDGTVAVGTADDIGLAGVTIDLIDANTSAVVAMTTTGPGGHYEFDNVLPLGAGDSYLVKEVVPANSTQTYGSAGHVITPASGADLKGNDFANFADFKIEGTKYNDVKGDDGTVAVGTADDIGLAGVTIDLIDANTSAVVAMTTTGPGGHYEFDNVLPLGAGDSYLVKEVVPANSTQTYGSAGYVITPASGADLKGNDFANFAEFSISGKKYFDANSNGKIDSGVDTPIGGVTIDLFTWKDSNHNGHVDSGETTFLEATTTATDGSYSFGNLAPGNYFVQELLPGGYTETFGTAGYTVAGTSGVNITNDNFANAINQALPGLTAGFWAQHQTDWDGIAFNDSKAATLESAGTLTKAYLPGTDDVNPLKTGLLLGDIDHSGTTNSGEKAFFLPLLAAQEIITQSTSSDAHVIMLNQLIASQLNDYNDGGHEPIGLIETAINWAETTYTAGTLTGGNADLNHDGKLETTFSATGKVVSASATIINVTPSTVSQLYVGESVTGSGIPGSTTVSTFGTNSITINHNATSNVNSDTLTFGAVGAEYNTSTQLFTSALSSSSPAWTAFSSVFNETTAGYHPHTGNALVDATHYAVTADGEGLKNALEAFNGGLAGGQLDVSADGSLVYWKSGGGD
ncbi:beta strand repeat-containing protein [Bradyrhizobium sp. LLZ17]|uniref:Beta strand repeat-containing protein n=1 Tax=Bradyrhizobium sp. LLZ17 TaxID=3239388 RepID=A0AB39XLP7_9BRAD